MDADNLTWFLGCVKKIL